MRKRDKPSAHEKEKCERKERKRNSSRMRERDSYNENHEQERTVNKKTSHVFQQWKVSSLVDSEPFSFVSTTYIPFLAIVAK